VSYFTGPIALITIIALLCWLGIWLLKVASQTKPKHYNFLCISGVLVYIPIYFILAVSPAHWFGLVAVILIAATCITLVMVNLVTRHIAMDSELFTGIVGMGQYLLPFVLMAVPEIERIVKLIL